MRGYRLFILLQAGEPRARLGGVAAVLRAGHGHLAGGQFVDDLGEALGRQILVVILADLGHGRVGAGAEALDLLPAELAICRKLVRLRRDLLAADADQILGPADHAGCGAANLNMRNGTNRLQLKHEVERGHFKRPDIGHAEHVGHIFDGRAGEPALLLLGAPQKRDHRARLAAFRVFGDLRLRPFQIGGREGEALGLVMVKTAQHQAAPVLMRMNMAMIATTAERLAEIRCFTKGLPSRR